jgi:hypothetical protein
MKTIEINITLIKNGSDLLLKIKKYLEKILNYGRENMAESQLSFGEYLLINRYGDLDI